MKKNYYLIVGKIKFLLILILTNSLNAQWALNGNSGTLPEQNYLGTYDNQSLVFKTNNIERLRIDTQGNIGINTNNPISKLHIDGNITLKDELKFNNSLNGPGFSLGGTSRAYIHIWGNGLLGSNKNQDLGILGQEFRNLNLIGNALIKENLGLGTNSPSAKLDIKTEFTDQDSNNVQAWTTNDTNYNLNLVFKKDQNGINQYFIQKFNGIDHNILSFYSGNVGIGTLNPDAKLAVKGKIHAQEIKVDLKVPADYVFQKYYTGISNLKEDYKLLSLDEVEEFTKKNHHLPEVPSAKEQKENGITLGKMSNTLLQKIEELTLYSIELNKKNKIQNELINNLSSKIIELEKKIK